MSDIGESNQRQSDFYWGWEDAKAGREPRQGASEAYLRGYRAAKPSRWPWKPEGVQ